MNQLHIGFTRNIAIPKGGFLWLGDDVPDLKRARVFDPYKHSFNPLQHIDYKRARRLTDIFYTISPQGENTLTVRNGKRDMLQALLNADRLDRVQGTEEVNGVLGDILASPVLKKVLCNPTNFSFNPHSVILAKIDRAELGKFDSLVLGLLLIEQYRGQVVIPDFGFYGRNVHTSLVWENRLIAGVHFLAELSDELRHSVLLITEKTAHGATYEDALTLARYARLAPGTNKHNDFLDSAMS